MKRPVLFLSKSQDARHFPPQDPERERLLEQLHQSPETYGLERSRWTLQLIGQQFLQSLTSLSGICRRLQKWQIARKQARLHINSPDPEYQTKVETVLHALAEARAHPAQQRLLYADELTFYRQPQLSPCYHEQGTSQPLAQWPGGFNTKYRIASSLDACTGEVVAFLASTVGVDQLCRWLGQVREHYGPALALSVAWDNWPVHKHPQVEAAAREHKIRLLYLPTYAPWTNPIEKLWRLLKQEVLRMHHYEEKERWPKLREWVQKFLRQYQKPSQELLRAVGLQQ